MIEVKSTQEWSELHKGGLIGLLEVSGVVNQGPIPEIDGRKRAVETALREKYNGYSRADFVAAPVLAEYERYYKKFDKTYHVQLQLESIVLKGKSLPNVSPLVDSNFVAEVETLILTAGHDVAKLQSPVIIDVSRGGDVITQMNGSTKPMREGDMVMRDRDGVCCSIIYGQDNRSPISNSTTHALYVAYAPPGIAQQAVQEQLDKILQNIKSFAPACVAEQNTILIAH